MKIAMRIMSILLSMIICTTIVVDSIIVSAHTETITAEEQQIFSTATIDDNFADDRIIVVFKNKASLEFIEYTEDSFPEINCKDVRILTNESINEAKIVMDNALEAISRDSISIIDTDINLSTFNTMVCLTLAETGKERVLEAIDTLQKRDDILYVGPDMVLTIESTESSYVTHSDPSDVREQIHLDELPRSFAGSFGVTVGIIDSGIDVYHPAFANVNFMDAQSYDYVEDVGGTPSDIIDENGHGTHVAGIIAGAINQALDFSGVIPGVTLVSFRIFDENGDGYMSDLVDAIEKADEYGIPLLNYSGGAEVDIYSVSNYIPLHNAIAMYDGLFICSAGNDGINNDLSLNHHYPSDYDDLNNLISVGACDLDNMRCGFSNYGAVDVDLFAPGALILSSYLRTRCNSMGMCADTDYHKHIDYGYHAKSGTSMATPFVTGVAAILLWYDHTLEANEIKSLIIDSAEECDTLRGLCSTGGILNASNALSLAEERSECNHIFNYSYTQLNYSTHTAVCRICGYRCVEYHSWSNYGTGYRCSKCLMTTNIIPGEMQNLSDEELILHITSLTDDELATLALALNEEERERFTALIPEREDDLVTE